MVCNGEVKKYGLWYVSQSVQVNKWNKLYAFLGKLKAGKCFWGEKTSGSEHHVMAGMGCPRIYSFKIVAGFAEGFE